MSLSLLLQQCPACLVTLLREREDACGPFHVDEQKQDDQLEPINNSSVPIQDIALKSSLEPWTTVMDGKRGSERSVLAVRLDDDELSGPEWLGVVQLLRSTYTKTA